MCAYVRLDEAHESCCYLCHAWMGQPGYEHLFAFIYTCVRLTYAYAHTYARTHGHAYACTDTYSFTISDICIHTCTHRYTHTLTHACRHTDTHTWILSCFQGATATAPALHMTAFSTGNQSQDSQTYAYWDTRTCTLMVIQTCRALYIASLWQKYSCACPHSTSSSWDHLLTSKKTPKGQAHIDICVWPWPWPYVCAYTNLCGIIYNRVHITNTNVRVCMYVSMILKHEPKVSYMWIRNKTSIVSKI